jgi:hypothetical protein
MINHFPLLLKPSLDTSDANMDINKRDNGNSDGNHIKTPSKKTMPSGAASNLCTRGKAPKASPTYVVIITTGEMRNDN